MYTPPFNTVAGDAEIRAMVAAARTGWLVTAGADRVPAATMLPVLWRGDVVLAHMAKANEHWRLIEDGMPALLVVTGPDAYISPTWYAAKREHGKVVPTWNYTAVHLAGTVRVHHDPAWLRHAVGELTDAHEQGRAQPWSVDDAPEPYLAGQLNGIVGLELSVTSVEGKAKLSQNRSDDDQRGVVEGLRAEPFAGADEIATAMAQRLTATPDA